RWSYHCTLRFISNPLCRRSCSYRCSLICEGDPALHGFTIRVGGVVELPPDAVQDGAATPTRTSSQVRSRPHALRRCTDLTTARSVGKKATIATGSSPGGRHGSTNGRLAWAGFHWACAVASVPFLGRRERLQVERWG